MDQADSVNLTYDYLDECEEYAKILETKNKGLKAAADKKKVAEGHLNASLKKAKDINKADSEIISEHKSDKKRLRNKVKAWKFVASLTSGIAAIFGAKIAISGG